MKEITNKEIKKISEKIVKKANESENDYDAIDEISLILKQVFVKMEILKLNEQNTL